MEESEYTQVEEPVDEGIQTAQKTDTPDSVSIKKSEEMAPVKTIPSKKSNEIEKPKTEIETPVFSAPDYPENWILEQKKEYKDYLTEIVLVSSFNPEEIKNSEVYAWSKNNQKFEWQDTISEFVDLETILASRTEIMKKGGFETEKMIVKIKDTGPQMVVMTGSFPAGLVFERKLDFTSSTYDKFIESLESVLDTDKTTYNRLPSGLRGVISQEYHFETLISDLTAQKTNLDKKVLYNTKEIIQNIKKINENIIDPELVKPVVSCLEREYNRLREQSAHDKEKEKERDALNKEISDVREKIIKILDLDWKITSRDWNDGQTKLMQELSNTMKEDSEAKGFAERTIQVAGKFPKKSENSETNSNEQNLIRFSSEAKEMKLSATKINTMEEDFFKAEQSKYKNDFNKQKAEDKWDQDKKGIFLKYIEKELKPMQNKLNQLNKIKKIEYAFEKIQIHQDRYKYLPHLNKIKENLKILCDRAKEFHGAKETWKVNLNGSKNIEIILD